MKLLIALRAKIILSYVVLPLFSHTASAQGFAWAQEIVSSTSSGNPTISAVTTDESSNGYFLGRFSGTADLDPGPGVQNVTAGGAFDMYILKKDAVGNFVWAKQVTGMTNSASFAPKGIGLDSSGNIYIGGFYREDFDFDPGPGVYQLSSYGGYHSFVLKLDPSGNFIWVKDMGNQSTSATMQMQSMKMDASANIFFACSFASNSPVTIDIDPGPVANDIPCPTDGNDMLIEKLDSAGNFVWGKRVSGPNNQVPWALTLDTLSNVYITGQLSGTADFDPALGVVNLSSTNSQDAFIAKYDSAGNYLWAGQISGGGDEVGKGIATDTFGNVVVTGYYDAGLADFDPGPGVYNITATSTDMFVLKLRADGSFAWAKSVHPAGNDAGVAITTDGMGNVYTAGAMFTSVDFDPGPGEYLRSGVAYVQKLDSLGNFAWASIFGGQYPLAIALDQANDIYVVGWSTIPGDFDPGPDVFTLTGNHAGFIEKLCGSSLAITADDSTVCAGDDAQLTTPAITGATYTWTLDGTVIPGNTNTITVTQPGVYEVYVDGGCPNASGPLYITQCTGVGETMSAAGIEVYPNPFDDVLTVKGLQVNDVVSLTDITGRVVHSWQGAKTTETFTINDVSAGYYVLKVMNEQGVVRVNVPVVKR